MEEIVCSCSKCIEQYKKEKQKLLKSSFKELWKSVVKYEYYFEYADYDKAKLCLKEMTKIINNLEELDGRKA